MAKHTDGPWHWQGAVKARTGELVENNRFLIGADGAWVLARMGRSPLSDADARLMAAAPDLLEACKAALDRHRQALAIRQKLTGIAGMGIAKEIAQMEAAIAKAEGSATTD
jgi:hypothetical protein